MFSDFGSVADWVAVGLAIIGLVVAIYAALKSEEVGCFVFVFGAIGGHGVALMYMGLRARL